MLLREAVLVLDALVRFIGDMDGQPWEDAREFLLRRELDEPPIPLVES